MSEQAPAEKPATPTPLRPLPAVPVPVGARSARTTFLRRRFLIAYAVLAAVLGAGIGAFVLMIGEERAPVSARWSTFQPSLTGTLGVRQIARAVSEKYKFASGTQLVGVIGGPMIVPVEDRNLPVSALLLASGRAGVPAEKIYVNYPEAGAFYQMCGAAENCSLPGSANEQRGALLSREALELALHTFRYLSADFVVVFLPPNLGAAMFWRRSDLAHLVSSPLSSTLRERAKPFVPGEVSAKEMKTIEAVVEPWTLKYEFRPLQDQSVLLILSPP